MPLLAGSEFALSRLELLFVYLVAAMALNFAFGFAGQLALGEPMIVAAGAYAAGLLSVNFERGALVTLPVAIGAGAIVSILLGLPSLRIRGWYFAILTFFGVTIIGPLVATFGSVTGGADGLAGIALPSVAGVMLPSWVSYEVFVIIAIITYVCLRNIAKSPVGIGLQTLRDHPTAAEACGLNVLHLKARVYLVIGLPCGAVGALFAHSAQVISPSDFDFNMILVLIGSVFLGGVGRLYGPIFGVVIFEGLNLWLGPFSKYNSLVLGIGVLIAAVIFKDGLLTWAASMWARLRRYTGQHTASDAAGDEVGAITSSSWQGLSRSEPPRAEAGAPNGLHLSGITVSVNSNLILDNVDLIVPSGHIVAVVGPNGSGKTTLLNAVGGFVAIADGGVTLDRLDVGGLSRHKIARSGLGRSFQTPQLVDRLSVLDNVALGYFGPRRQNAFCAGLRLSPYWSQRARGYVQAEAACRFVGLTPRTLDASVSTLPLGLKRVVEIGRALAGDPSVMCLDEPAAGLNREELDNLARVLRDVARSGVAVLLVEHNLSFVRRVSDHVCLLEDGQVLDQATNQGVDQWSEALREYFNRYEGSGV
jgi:branched-chain amino acid transport system permease protein